MSELAARAVDSAARASELAARAGDPAGPPGGSVSGIVLAGGRGSRLGGDKLGRPLRGRPLLDHALLALAPLVAELIVVGPAHGALPPSPPELRPTPIRAFDLQAGLGPLAGVVVGLGLASQPRSLIVGGDQPALVPALLAGLLAAAADSLAGAVVLADGDGWSPLPSVVVTRAALVEARRRLAAPHRSLKGLLVGLGLEVVDEAAWRPWDPAGAWRQDVDSPADLRAAEGGAPEMTRP